MVDFYDSLVKIGSKIRIHEKAFLESMLELIIIIVAA